MQITPAPVDVSAMVHELVEEIASAHPDRALRVELEEVGVAWVDRSRIAQMLSNLIANAVEYSPPGEPVVVGVRGDGGRLVFTITNGGEPIPAGVIPHLFEPFVRANVERERKGLGLGLYIASEIARAHGGLISVASSAAKGTTFRVDLPRDPNDP